MDEIVRVSVDEEIATDGSVGVQQSGAARKEVCAGLGLMLGWMMSLLLRGGVLSGPFAGQRSLSFDPFFVAAAASAALCFAAFCLPLRFLGRLLDRRATFVALGVVVAVAAVGTGVLGTVPLRWGPLVGALGIACGACMAALLMLWLLALADFDPRDTVLIVLVDILMALGAFLLVHFTGKVIGSPWATTLVSMALLVGSFGFLVRRRDLLVGSHGTVQEPSPILTKLALFAFVTCLAVEYASGFMVSAARDFFFQGNHDRFLWQIVGLLACAAVTMALAVALRVLDKRTGTVVVALYRIIVLVLVCGLVMALLPFEALFVATDTVILLACFLVLFGTWAIGLHAVFLKSHDTIGSIGIMLASQFLGLLAGFLLALQAMAAGGSSPWAQAGLAAVLVLVVVVTLFVFTDLDASAVERVGLRDATSGGNASLEERARVVAEQFGLTEREGEVLLLLARGRNAVSIQEALCVSYNTVKVHKRNIYLKMDIHSQQELLDIMEDVSLVAGAS